MEHHISIEAEELISNFKKQRGPIALHQAFDVCILNSLWTMLAGERFSLDDKRLAELLDIVHASFRMLDMSGGLLNQMPFLRFVAPQKSGYSILVNNLNKLWSFLKVLVSLCVLFEFKLKNYRLFYISKQIIMIILVICS